MSYTDPFVAMQAAVDIVENSRHPTNKVAATLFGRGFSLSRTNYWPDPIFQSFGMDTDIGNSSGTVHAETACILESGYPTEGAGLCITDPFCPNCAKNIAEAGIKKIYIDHKGFDKDFFKRRSGHFETMSMQVCEKAGISVYELWRKDERVVPICESMPSKFVAEDSPIFREPIESPNDGVFTDILTQAFKKHDKRKFCVAFVTDKDGKTYSLIARGHAVTGFTTEDPEDLAILEQRENNKYSLFQEPVNRVLMYCARHGYKINENFFFSTLVPTSREQVNLVGAGIKRITVGDIKKARDPDAMKAMEQLSNARIMTFF